MVIRTLETQPTKTQICYTYLRTFSVNICFCSDFLKVFESTT